MARKRRISTGRMKDEVRTNWMSWNSQFEGNVPFLYLDNHKKPDGTSAPLVTVAIGNLMEPIELALGLPLFRPDGARATPAEIAADWHAVKARTDLAPHGGMAFASVARLRLTPEGVENVVLSKLSGVDTHLSARYPEWESLPWQAQQAILSMSWAAGEHAPWPHFDAALKAQDWDTCAEECHLDDSRNPGLVPRNAANKALFLSIDRQSYAPVSGDFDGPVANESGPAG